MGIMNNMWRWELFFENNLLALRIRYIILITVCGYWRIKFIMTESINLFVQRSKIWNEQFLLHFNVNGICSNLKNICIHVKHWSYISNRSYRQISCCSWCHIIQIMNSLQSTFNSHQKGNAPYSLHVSFWWY